MNNKNKRVLIIIVLVCFATMSFCVYFDTTAYADALTLEMVCSAAYALGQNYGMIFNFTNGNSESTQTWIQNTVNSYLAGRTVTEVFGSEALRVSAGKLIIPGLVYAGVKNLWEQYIYEKSISSSGLTDISAGITSFGVELGVKNTDGYFKVTSSPSPFDSTCVLSYYKNGSLSHTGNYSVPVTGYHDNAVYGVETVIDGTRYRNWVWFNGYDSFHRTVQFRFSWYPAMTVADYPYYGALKMGLNDQYGFPDLPDVGYDWEGTIGDGADTNLEDLMRDIFTDRGANDLVVDGEIVEPGPAPTPVPTPVPVDPDTPLQDVPWEGLNDLIGTTGESINEQIQSQIESMTSAQEATTEAVESLTGTIESALDVPAEEDLPEFKFDLRELFPFCIPFDIYRLLSSFDAEPVAPHVQLPIVIESIGFSYNLDLDFSAWNPVAQAMRTAELIVYAIGLAWATGKVIKW